MFISHGEENSEIRTRQRENSSEAQKKKLNLCKQYSLIQGPEMASEHSRNAPQMLQTPLALVGEENLAVYATVDYLLSHIQRALTD